MKDYHDLHLKCDVLLLGDMFEKFKTSSLRNYQLCQSHYLSAPALSWNVMFSMTKVELELISDADMYSFFKKGMAGRVYHISERFKYLKSYDLKQESRNMLYLDANNSYGYAMSKFLPTAIFKWIDPKEF